ncbi:tRNA(Ile2)-agmatinylcytidine synthase [Methanolinea mesophila]|uniref:tRNA(Ile)(2)-agmatinylcytidine synthase n=1 Tax=Methanolinea mesophila TaxID=547055 RepID=UPI001AE70A74|nr:tRNA(Ile)(2)-agmatinylcytidine synthase [Methanolinea mesophila]MBP1928675.1 tRNA(Ile2)-agmatinylcytidine synthase [Methanolinea mesophila]
MRIGIDDTDSPRGMCTTYLGALLARRLASAGMVVRELRLVRLNPNVAWKTRGNAAIAITVDGSPATAFEMACRAVEEYADMDCENTNPGVVVATRPLDPAFYVKAVRDFCEIEEAEQFLVSSGAIFRGYKNKRGLIGAAAAVASEFPDCTYELLAYRDEGRWGTPRAVDRESIFSADSHTFPHTWDSVDRENRVVVCVPHSPDPVLFGIRGERPGWLSLAREHIISEKPSLEQVFVTNQGTDAHLLEEPAGRMKEGCSYLLRGTVAGPAVTAKGGHVSFPLECEDGTCVQCMAYEPTKNFREIVRSLLPGDRLVVAGSYKGGSINLEKLRVVVVAAPVTSRPPVCERCGKRMTSAGTGKGFKCRRCGGRSREAETRQVSRSLAPGWYEVPPIARRHLARPLCRGDPGSNFIPGRST